MRSTGRRIVTLALSVGAVAFSSSALIGQRGTVFSISGRVVDDRTMLPVADATVVASSLEGTVTQRTGGTGDFFFTFASPVRVRLWADRPGSVRAYYQPVGGDRSGVQGSTVDLLVKGTHVSGVLLKLSAAAAVSGKVSRGTQPVARSLVHVLRRDYRGAGSIWRPVFQKSTSTDERGLYRIAGLEPGNYLVAVMGDTQPGRRTSARPTFAPGVSAAGRGRVLALSVGTEASDADIQLESTDAVGSIAGRVLNGDSGSGDITVRLRRVDAGNEIDTEFDEVSTVTDDSGTFRFSDIPVGPYKLQVVLFPRSDQPLLNLTCCGFGGYAFGDVGLVVAPQGPPQPPAPVEPVPSLPSAPTLYAEHDVFVEAGRSEPMLIPLQAAATISGRVSFQDGSPPPPDDLVKIPMLIRPANGDVWGGIPQARIEPDGSFRSPGLPPGDYVVVPLPARAQLPDKWNTIALTSGGMDFLGGAITLGMTDVTNVRVTLSTKSAEVSGTVRRPNLSLPERALPSRIIIFPKSERLRTFYYAAPSPRRVLLVERDFHAVLPPGEYLAAAVIGDVPALWMTSDYLDRLLPWATPIRLGVGEKVNVSLEARLVGR